jgi:hypothetical protein
MTLDDFIVIKKFEEMFGGFVFQEEPGDRWIYEKDGRCYSLPDMFLIVMEKSIEDEKDHLAVVGTEVTYDSDEIR